MEDFETHPRGTAEVLAQLRAEREALTVQVEEQRRLLGQARDALGNLPTTNHGAMSVYVHIIDHLKGKA